MDNELQAFFEWCEKDQAETMMWLRHIADDESDWNSLLNVPTIGDTF